MIRCPECKSNAYDIIEAGYERPYTKGEENEFKPG